MLSYMHRPGDSMASAIRAVFANHPGQPIKVRWVAETLAPHFAARTRERWTKVVSATISRLAQNGYVVKDAEAGRGYYRLATDADVVRPPLECMRRLRLALRFVEDVGGIEQARQLLEGVEHALGLSEDRTD